MLKNIIGIVVLVLIIGLISYNLFTSIGIKTNVEEYENKMDSIQVKVDSVKQANKELDVKLSHIDTVVYSITKEITHVDKTIKELKQNTDEKVNNVDNHADSELSRLLSDRYNQ
jgi:chromosome segregation ATPase